MGYVGNEPSVNFTSFAKQDITGDGGASYTLTYAVANANEIEVFVNNVRQEPTEAYTVSGTALTMTGNVASTDDFYVIYLGKALQTTTPPDGSVTSAKLDTNIAISGTLDVSGAFTSQGINDDATSTALTLDSSGNLLVGTTNSSVESSSTDEGVNIFANKIGVARDGGVTANFNRLTSDGDIIKFRKNGTQVGSIITQGGNLIMASGSVGVGVGGDNLYPTNGSGASTDNTMDVGDASARFDDVFATNGTIQTSDRNEKQDIEELSEAEQRVAVVAKGLMKKFRWIDSVAEKGDNARTHFGIIAQDLQDAFTAEGLDAGDYAMFTSDTWTDDDGNEQTRLGVRYSELLAFIISAL